MKNKLLIRQLDKKLEVFASKEPMVPAFGWVKAIRKALGMSLDQLGRRLSISRQSVRELEIREKQGTVSLNSLNEVARALNMKLIYAFVPNDGSLQAMIEKRAKEMAKQIVLRTSNTMQLEDQENSKERIEKAIEERAETIIREMPKFLWD